MNQDMNIIITARTPHNNVLVLLSDCPDWRQFNLSLSPPRYEQKINSVVSLLLTPLLSLQKVTG